MAVCPTPTPTPTVTSTATPTPTNTITPTNTPSVTPIYNLTFMNGSEFTSSNAVIVSFEDDFGVVPLTGATQSFPINDGQTLRAIHGTTNAFPRIDVRGTDFIDWIIYINGNIYSLDSGVELPTIILIKADGTPLLASENVELQILRSPI
jgi:hypothetical protein